MDFSVPRPCPDRYIDAMSASSQPHPERRPLPAPKTDFIGLEGKVHLATGGEPPLLVAHRIAFERFAADKSDGFPGYHRHWDMAEGLRQRVARWLGLEPGDIGLVGNASEGIARVATGIDWRPGENAVVPALDYASGRYALADLQRRGVELRLVPAEGWALDPDRLAGACDARTRLVYVSQVNALTGQHLDMAALSRSLPAGVVLLNDASHAFGAVPVDGSAADFTVTCCYKFLLGAHDGIVAWNRRRQPNFIAPGIGWAAADRGEGPDRFHRKSDARQMEYGNPGHLGAYMMCESLDYLDSFGIEAIATHVCRLSGRMVEAMRGVGLDVMTPADPAQRAANAAFNWPDTGAFMERAARDGILVWGDNGRIRASAHLFTTEADIDRFSDGLPRYIR